MGRKTPLSSSLNCNPKDRHLKKCPSFGFLCLNELTKNERGTYTMSKCKCFTPMQMRMLESNPNVVHVSEKAITYTSEFKLQAIKSYESGTAPMQIFLDAGFDVAAIGTKNPQTSLKRWRKSYRTCGEEGLLVDRRGRASTGRPSSKELTTEEKLKRAEAKIKLLEVENEFLKKLEALERQVKRDR